MVHSPGLPNDQQISPFRFRLFGPAVNSAYLRHCAAISLVKRAAWVACAGAAGLLFGLSFSGWAGLLSAVLGTGLMASAVAAQSMVRHRTDWQARTQDIGALITQR
ncbi:MAG: hypothetical protein JWQ08_966 [Deinococcus sp.]|jgi:hypothetical protein|nr:hypothetical protein [Deinococcus sp.]